VKEKALDNKCPSCGASITFNIEKQLWHCEYCDSEFNLDDLNKRTSNASTIENNKVRETIDVNEFTCKNCGAKVITDELNVSTFCVYCGNVAILQNKLTGIYAPDYIIPFKNTKNEIIESFKNLQKGRPLMPKLFNDPKNIEKITGIYIPFWLFDVNVSGNAIFYGEKISSWTSGDYRYTKTDTYELERNADISFLKVPVDAASRFPNDLMQSIEPFDYEKLVKYNHAYLAGFLAEKYDVDENMSKENAITRSVNSTIDEMKSTCPFYSGVRLKNESLNKCLKNSDYVFLPVWLLNVNYNNKTYTFAMNGQSGEMVGNIPIHKGKAILMWISVFLVSFLVLSIGWWLFL